MLDKLAEALLERETMSAAEIRELLGLPSEEKDEESEAPAASPDTASTPAPAAPVSPASES